MTPHVPDAGGPAGTGDDPGALPDFTGPRAAPTALAPPPPEPAPLPVARAPRPGLPAWSVVLLVLVVAAGQVGIIALLLVGARAAIDVLAVEDDVWISDPGWVEPLEPGTVRDADDVEVTDGTGGWDRPATVGEHSFSWSTWDDGLVTVRVTDLEVDATLPNAAGEDVLEDGSTLLIATLDLHYAGSGQFQPGFDLWPWLETDLAYHEDMLSGLAPDALSTVDGVEDGETVTVRLGFVVPDRELDSARLSLETSDGGPLYYAVR